VLFWLHFRPAKFNKIPITQVNNRLKKLNLTTETTKCGPRLTNAKTNQDVIFDKHGIKLTRMYVKDPGNAT
jgi:hypothetical protein